MVQSNFKLPGMANFITIVIFIVIIKLILAHNYIIINISYYIHHQDYQIEINQELKTNLNACMAAQVEVELGRVRDPDINRRPSGDVSSPAILTKHIINVILSTAYIVAWWCRGQRVRLKVERSPVQVRPKTNFSIVLSAHVTNWVDWRVKPRLNRPYQSNQPWNF